MPSPRSSLVLALPPLCLALFACVGADDLASSVDSTSTSTSTSDTATDTDTDTSAETSTDTGDPAQTYPPGPYGTEVGDTIADLVFYRGDGEPLALSTYYAQPPPALIIFGTASW